MIVYPYRRLPSDILNSIPDPSWGVAHSDTGWMKSETFYEYEGNVLYPYLKKKNVVFPIILFLDGHRSHLDKNLSDLCTKLNIILIALYPNATRVLQPADVSAFRPLKEGWRKGVLDWRRENPNSELTKQNFTPTLHTVIKNFENKKDTITNGFRATGLCPWNANAIDFSKCLGKRNNINSNNSSIIEVSSEAFSEVSSPKYDRFLEIVGDDYIEKFNKFDEVIGNHSEEFLILYQLWKEYNGNKNASENTENRKKDEINNAVSELKFANFECFLDNLPVVDEDLGDLANADIEIINQSVSSTGTYTVMNINNRFTDSLENILMWPASPVRKGKKQQRNYLL